METISLNVLQLDHRGYCNRTSVLGYSLPNNNNNNDRYKLRYPPAHYPAAAPYAALTKFFSKLIKERIIHVRLLKQLLYPEYLNKMNLSLVKIRHHRTECVILTNQVSDCRFSIVRCDSDSDTDSSSNSDQCLPRQDAIDESNSSSNSSSNPFGYIRYYNPQNDTETKYESFIDYGELVHSSEAKMVDNYDDDQNKKTSITVTSTAKFELVHQNSESSEASSHIVSRPHLACEDLVNIDENLPLGDFKISPKPFIPTIRQSLPSKFVGNKFSESSLTTIDIPQWHSNSDNCLNKGCSCGDDCSTTHSSSLALEVNPLPLPDRVVAELLYNIDREKSNILTKSESVDSDKSFKTVIKPPTVFQNNSGAISLPLDRKYNRPIDPSGIRRCVSSHFIQMGFGCSDSAFCTELSCQSPRSSDSGMAGSCTLNSPDFGGADQERCSIVSMSTGDYHLKQEHIMSLSEIEARDFNSQCQCTSPFGSTPRTSCETSVSSTTSHPYVHSVNLVNVNPKLLKAELPRCIEKWEPAQKSKSLDCVSTNKISETNNENAEVFRSGLYAHWWLKAKIPACVVKGIYEETRSPNTGKGFLFSSFWVYFFLTFTCYASFNFNHIIHTALACRLIVILTVTVLCPPYLHNKYLIK